MKSLINLLFTKTSTKMAHIEPVGKPKGRISALKSFRYASGISTPGEFNALCCALYVATHVSQPQDGYDAVYHFFYKTGFVVPLSHSEYYDPAECQRILHATRAVISKHVLPGVFTDMYHDAAPVIRQSSLIFVLHSQIWRELNSLHLSFISTSLCIHQTGDQFLLSVLEKGLHLPVGCGT